MTGLGPFDLHGPHFLMLYSLLAAMALVLSLAIPPWLRPPGRPGRLRGDDELALLAGGADRLAEATVTRLMARGALTAGSSSLTVRDPRAGETIAERRVLALSSPAPWTAVQGAIHEPARALRRDLTARGLLVEPGEAAQLRLLHALPLVLLLAFGCTKWVIGTLRDRPVGILTALLVVTLVAVVLRLAVLNPRTRAGEAALADARRQHSRLRRAATSEEAPTAVALFGTAVLAGSFLADFHRLRSAASGSDSGSSGDTGGGGCGGGGCGGCGS